MAKYSTKNSAQNNQLMFVLLIALLAGFVGGYMTAKMRYTEKIAAISQMNMDKATAIDDLNRQIQVLGASTEE